MKHRVITSLLWLSVFLPASTVCAQTPQGQPVRQQTGTTPPDGSLSQQGKHECVEGPCYTVEKIDNDNETYYIKIKNDCKAGYIIEFTIWSDNPIGEIHETIKSGEVREINRPFQGNVKVTPKQIGRQVVRKRKEEPQKEVPPKDKTSGDWILVRDDCENGCRFAKDGVIKVCGNCGAELITVSSQLIRPDNEYYLKRYMCNTCQHSCDYKVKLWK